MFGTGIGLTVIGHLIASASGGFYIVFTGLIIFGLARFIAGFFHK